MSEDTKVALTAGAFLLTLIWNLYQFFRFKQQDIVTLHRELEDLRTRQTAVETKIGLFWHLVEEHMSSMLSKANPIQLSLIEKDAAQMYEVLKAKSPTGVLKTLECAIDRELRKKYFTPDETLIFTLLLGAIRSQLLDRGEWNA